MEYETPALTIGRQTGDGVLRFSHHAMATVFEVFISGEDPVYAQQAAFEAFQEADRLEQELSRFIPNSDISCINALVPSGEMLLGPNSFACLQLAARCSAETNGAFDVTAGALVECLLTRDKQLRTPPPEVLRSARNRTGMHHLQLNEETQSVKVLDIVPLVDLGAIGKGYAVDRIIELLKEWDVTNVLVHGGTSSVYGRGAMPGRAGWPVTLSSPASPEVVLARLDVVEFGLGGSGVKKGRHIIDPRTATPVPGGRAAWVAAESAARADALSTACMVMSLQEIRALWSAHPELKILFVETPQDGEEVVHRFGFDGGQDDTTRLSANNS